MKLEVIDFLDEGFGDSQMLSSGDNRLLIDTYVSYSWDVLNDWLNSHQYTDFDIYISHYHDDHIGNVTNILNDGKYKVSKLYLPDYGYMTGSSTYMQNYISMCDYMMSTARNKGVEIVYLGKGSTFNVGDVTANVLWGNDYTSSTHDTHYINNNSLVTRFTCGNTRYLNAGDIEEETEYELLDANVDLAADICKLNHHGGNTSNRYDFLYAVNASFYYYNYCEDTTTSYSPKGSWSYYPTQTAKKFGNVASLRYNGNITYNVYDDVITQDLERNYNTQTVYLYDENDPTKLKAILTQDINTASTKYIDDRAYGGNDYTTTKRSGTYADDGWLMGNGEPQYYFKDNEPVKGWLQDDGAWYYLNTSTAKKEKGWLTLNGKTYFLDEQGKMQTGFVKIGAAVHHFNDQGVQTKTGWAQIDGDWYYFGAYNKLMFGMQTIGGKKYIFDNNTGAMLTGPVVYNGNLYILSDSGSMYTGGWTNYKGNWYYIYSNGTTARGWKYLSGKWYYMNSNGVMQTGKVKLGNTIYLFDSSGAMCANRWASYNGSWYYLSSDGSAVKGWKKLSGVWYYMNSEGVMQTGKLKLGSTIYILNSSGAMCANRWATYNGSWYYLNSDGSAAKGWKYLSGKWYYMNSEGVMLTGWQNIDGVWYYMNGSGAWVPTARRA